MLLYRTQFLCNQIRMIVIYPHCKTFSLSLRTYLCTLQCASLQHVILLHIALCQPAAFARCHLLALEDQYISGKIELIIFQQQSLYASMFIP